MIYKYEMACKEAGMREEDIQALRRELDKDYKRLNRENEKKERAGVTVMSLSLNDSEGDEYEQKFPDPTINIEEVYIHNWELQRLEELMSELVPTDRDFLYDCFSGERALEKRIFEKYGLQRKQMQYKRKKLLEQLR